MCISVRPPRPDPSAAADPGEETLDRIRQVISCSVDPLGAGAAQAMAEIAAILSDAGYEVGARSAGPDRFVRRWWGEPPF